MSGETRAVAGARVPERARERLVSGAVGQRGSPSCADSENPGYRDGFRSLPALGSQQR